MTGLRFFLALWVILHHLTGRGMMLEEWALRLPAPVHTMIRGGYLAVQTFFILSGFVLARTYLATDWNRESLFRFAIARFARIYPAYLLSLLVVSRFILETLAKPGRGPAEKLALLGNYGFLLQGWSGPLAVGWNTPAWSLSCEFFFYLCFPALFFVLREAGWRVLTVAMALSLAVPVLLAHAGVPGEWKPVHHLSDFVAGIAAAGFYHHLAASRFSLRGKGAWLYLPAFAAGAALIVNPSVLDGSWANLNTALRPLNVILLLGFALGGGLLSRGLSTRALEYLGQASYSMYILHVPLLWWYSRYALHKLGPAPHTAASFVFLCLVIGFSIAAFEYVEMPANRWLRAWAANRVEAPVNAVALAA